VHNAWLPTFLVLTNRATLERFANSSRDQEKFIEVSDSALIEAARKMTRERLLTILFIYMPDVDSISPFPFDALDIYLSLRLVDPARRCTRRRR
jgi:hypothetical protein